MPHKLVEFKGYTVDWRLKEFRRIILGEMPEFIPFDSERGRELKAEMRKRRVSSKRILTKEDSDSMQLPCRRS